LNTTDANVSNGFVLENIGNINATLWIKTNKNATGFVMDNGAGGSSPSTASPSESFLYKVRECGIGGISCNPASLRQGEVDTGASCGASQITLGVYRNVNATTSPSVLGDKICNQFGWEDIKDELRIDIGVILPQDTPLTAKGAIMTAQAEMPS